MTPTSVPGNDGGFVLLDAILGLFIAGIILLAAYGGITSVLRLSAGTIERSAAIIEEQNRRVIGGSGIYE
jgi:hypothetical protein